MAEQAVFMLQLVITGVARAGYGLSGGISLACLFSLLAGIWVWTLPETRGTIIRATEVARPPAPEKGVSLSSPSRA